MADTARTRGRGPSMQAALRKALKDATWITDADAAAVALAKNLAVQIDRLKGDRVSPYTEVATKINSTSVQLTQVMDSIGLTTRGRKALDIAEPDTSQDELDKLRRAHRRTAAK